MTACAANCGHCKANNTCTLNGCISGLWTTTYAYNTTSNQCEGRILNKIIILYVFKIYLLSDVWFSTLSTTNNFVFRLALILGDLYRVLEVGVGLNLGLSNSDLLVVIGLIKRNHVKNSYCTGRLINDLFKVTQMSESVSVLLTSILCSLCAELCPLREAEHLHI